MLVVIPCGAGKLPHPAYARDLYTGPLFRSSLRAGERLVERHRGTVAILSARHGLVELDRVVEPYDLTLGQPGAIDAASLRPQLARFDGGDDVVALLPKRYDRLLADAVGTAPPNPLRGSRGIGEQRGILARIARGELDPLTTVPVERTPAEIAYGWLSCIETIERYDLHRLVLQYDSAERRDPDRYRWITRGVRQLALGCIATACAHGFDGGVLAPAPRSDGEWRAAEIHVGSGLLRDLGGNLRDVDWLDVVRRCEREVDVADPEETR